MFTYLLNHDPFIDDPTPQKVLEFVRSNAFTHQFLAPFAGTIFIKSEHTLRDLIGSYHPFMNPSAFTLTAVSPGLISGLFPVDYWQWINSENPPPIRNIF